MRRQRLARAGETPRQRSGRGVDRVGTVGDSLAGRARREASARELLALGAARAERLLGTLALLGDLLELALDGGAPLPRLRHQPLGLRELATACTEVVACELPARLERLSLDPRVQLGRLRLPLQRPQPRPRLALDVERSIEVVLRALELQLCAPAALAVLAQAGRLLDQQPPVPRLGGHDRLDPPLRDRPSASPCRGRCRTAARSRRRAGTGRPRVGTRPRRSGRGGGRSRSRGRRARASPRCRRAPARPRPPAPSAGRARRRRSRPASTGRGRRRGTALRAPTARRR